jgi:hypothetical protein
VDSDNARGAIRDHHGDQKGTHAVRAPGAHHLHLLHDATHPTDSGPDQNAHAVPVALVHAEVGIFKRLQRGGHRKLGESIHAAGVLGAKSASGIKILDLAGYLRLMLARVEEADWRNT